MVSSRGINLLDSNPCCQNAVPKLHPIPRNADANARPCHTLVCPRIAKRTVRSVAYTAEELAVADVASIDSPSSPAVAPLPRRCVTGAGASPPAPSEHLPTAVAMAAIVLGSA